MHGQEQSPAYNEQNKWITGQIYDKYKPFEEELEGKAKKKKKINKNGTVLASKFCIPMFPAISLTQIDCFPHGALQNTILNQSSETSIFACLLTTPSCLILTAHQWTKYFQERPKHQSEGGSPKQTALCLSKGAWRDDLQLNSTQHRHEQKLSEPATLLRLGVVLRSQRSWSVTTNKTLLKS